MPSSHDLRCNNCGFLVARGHRFCSNCGIDLGSRAPSSADDQPTVQAGRTRSSDDQPTLPTGGADAAARPPVGAASAGADAEWPLCENHYDEVKKIGQGGMGAVWLVKDRRNGRLLCRKRPQDLTGLVMTRFLSEIRVLNDNLCKDIVECTDFGRDADGPFLVMPYYRRGSLYMRVKERGKLDEKALHELALAMGRALSHLHGKSVLHRDIKPANILLTDDDRPVLADFGLVRIDAGQSSTRGGLFGTAGYMAPELQDGVEASPVTDIYALGQTLRYAATGCAPGAGRDADIPSILQAFVLRCTSQDPRARFQSAQEFLQGLEATREATRETRFVAAATTCPHCNEQIGREAQHCTHCGKSVFAPCGACSHPMRHGARHCEKCGCSPETWQKAVEMQAQGEELVRQARFEELHRLTAQLARLTPGAIRLCEALRKRGSELEPKVNVLRRRAQAAERENGPRAAAPIWRQVVDLCAADAEALDKLQTVEVRERRHAFDLARVMAETSLGEGDLAQAAQRLDELRQQAADADEKAACDNFGRRLAAANRAALDERTQQLDQLIRQGDAVGAREALRILVQSGFDQAEIAAYEGRIRAIQRAVWRRDLRLTALFLVLVSGVFLFAIYAVEQRAFDAGGKDLREGRFAAASERLDGIWWPLDGRDEARAAARTLAAATGWSDASAVILHGARKAVGDAPGLKDLADDLEKRLRARLPIELQDHGLLLAGGTLRRRDGAAADEPFGPWRFALDGAIPQQTDAALDLVCRHTDGAVYRVTARIRRNDAAPRLQLAAAADADAGALLVGAARDVRVQLRDDDQRAGDPAPTFAVAVEPPNIAHAEKPVQDPAGDWTVRIVGDAVGAANVTVTATDFCGLRGEPLVLPLQVAMRPDQATAPAAIAVPEAPTLTEALPPATMRIAVTLVATAARADTLEVVDATSGRLRAPLASTGNGGFRGDVPLVIGMNRLRLVARNAGGERSSAEALQIVVDRTPPKVVGELPSLVEVDAELAVQFDEELGDASAGDLQGVRGQAVLLKPCDKPGPFRRTVRAVDRCGNTGEEVSVAGVAVRRTPWSDAAKLPGTLVATGDLDQVVVIGADRLSLVTAKGPTDSVDFGGIGRPIKHHGDVASQLALVHDGGFLSAWKRDGTIQPFAPPRRLLRRDENVHALAVFNPDVVLLVTEQDACLVDPRDGWRDRKGLGRLPVRPIDLEPSGSNWISLLADGRVASAISVRPSSWSVASATDVTPTDIQAITVVSGRNSPSVLAVAGDGTVYSGTFAKDLSKGLDWQRVAEATRSKATTISCSNWETGFAVGSADGSIRIYQKTGPPLTLRAGPTGSVAAPIRFLAGPAPSGKGLRRLLVGDGVGDNDRRLSNLEF